MRPHDRLDSFEGQSTGTFDSTIDIEDPIVELIVC